MPPSGKKFVVFIDGVNMPVIECYVLNHPQWRINKLIRSSLVQREFNSYIFLFLKIEYKDNEIFDSQRPFIFVDSQKKTDLQDRINKEVKDYNQLFKVINEFLQKQSKLNFVLFLKDVIEHLTRVYRVLRLQRGHYMLIGVGGSSKKSLTQLGALLAGCKLEILEFKRNYGKKEFKDILFKIMCEVRIKNKLIALYFTDILNLKQILLFL